MTPIRHRARAARPAAGAVAVMTAGLLLGSGAPAAAVPDSPPTAPFAWAAAPSPKADSTKVKYYIVTKQADGQPEFLFSIAEKTLGDGNRFNEIFELNKGRVQRDGGVLRTPTSIAPGWVLQLPPDAKGTGVQEGIIPVGEAVAPPSQAAPPANTGATTPADAGATAPQAAPPGPSTGDSAGLPLAIGGGFALVVAAAAGVLMLRRRATAAPAPAGGPAAGPSTELPEAFTPGTSGAVGAPYLDSPAWSATTTVSPFEPATSRASRSVAPRASASRGAAQRVTASAPAAEFEAEPADVAETPDVLTSGRRPAGPRAAVSISAASAAAARAASPAAQPARPAAARRTRPAAEPEPRRGGLRRAASPAHHVQFGDDLVEVRLGPGQAIGQDVSVAWMPVPYETPEGGAAFVCLGSAEGMGCLFVDLAQAPGTVALSGDAGAAHRLLESVVLQLSVSPVLDHACATAVGPLAVLADDLDRIEQVGTLAELVARRQEEGDPPFEFVFATVTGPEDEAALAELLDGPGRVIPIVLGDTDAEWQLSVEPGDPSEH
ncbi:hypothetical protein AB0C77_13875 [Streptomyces sp. NPDC048629]|uniref:hypothetical protein n=1 Tax=Streptomyces sp. NPDC048629 TaxID=3154824 RepID=UPI00343E5743